MGPAMCKLAGVGPSNDLGAWQGTGDPGAGLKLRVFTIHPPLFYMPAVELSHAQLPEVWDGKAGGRSDMVLRLSSVWRTAP